MSHQEIDYERQIREQGYRLTPQRQIIMDTLCAIGEHASANEVYDRVQVRAPAIDRATVYRTLHFFRDLNLVVTIEAAGETLYEVAGLTPHHHLVCRCCGRELQLDDRHLQEFVAQLERVHGFAAEINHLVVSGTCRECRQAAQE